jgi:hypothetical protein
MNDPVNYRPISNLNTISKMLERLVLTRIVPHVSSSSNFDEFQSAYRKHHSTEMALLKVTDDIFTRFADHQSTILVALDQSAAFDCIDHQTLIRRLNHSFGLTGKAIGWFSSYLESRSTFVRWKQASSSVQSLATGVPQGSATFLIVHFIAFQSHSVFRSKSSPVCGRQTNLHSPIKK